MVFKASVERCRKAGKIMRDAVYNACPVGTISRPMYKSGPYAGVNITPSGPRLFGGVREGMGGGNVSDEFRNIADTLPASNSSGSVFSNRNYINARILADAAANRVVPIKPLIGQAVSREVDFISDANAQGLSGIENGVTLSMMVDNGIITPEQKANGVDLNSLDPAKVQAASQLASQALAPLKNSLQFGSKDEVAAAYGELAKQFPELFPEPKTGLKGEVIVGGKVKLYNPMDRARYANQIQLDSKMGWDEKAIETSELNHTFTVKNPKRY